MSQSTQSQTWKERLTGQMREEWAREIDVFETQIDLRKKGKFEEKMFAETRLRRGIYGQRYDNGQRHDGEKTQELKYPCGDLTKGPVTVFDAPGMMRIKIPYGKMTAAQMDVLCDLAEEYSDQILHVTTRQDIQLHFVHIEDTPDLMRRLAAVGVTTREACGNSVRNITGCPYAGTSETEIFDVTPYAEAMTRYFLRHPLSGVLPRKFKIAFEGCTEDHALASIHDIGWRARIVDGRKGFRVTVAGGTSILPVSGYVLYDFLPVEEMFNAAEAVVRVFHRFGDYKHPQRNRMKFVVRQLGWDGYRARFEECLDEFKKEGGARLPFDPASTRSETAPDWAPAEAPTLQAVAAMASTPVNGPGIMPGTVRLQPLPDAFVRWMRSNVSKQRQPG